MRKYFFSMIIGLFLIGFLVACGDSSDEQNASSEPDVSENNNEEVDDTEESSDEESDTEESTFTTIEEGVLSFGSSGLYKPFNYEDLDGNETGFEVELGEAIAKEMGLEPKPVFTQDFGALLEEVNTDRIDVIMGSFTITEERAEVVDFSDPYYTSGPIFYVHNDTNDIETFDDLEGKNVGVVANSVYEDTVLEYIPRSEEHTSELQSRGHLVCRLLLAKK